MIAIALAVLLAQTQITATLVEGTVTASGQPLAQGGDVRVGDVIETGPDSRAEIALPAGAVIRIGERSKVTVDDFAPKKSFSLKLALGNVWAKVHKLLSDETFQIETENAVAGVRGTEFRLEVAPGEDDLLRVYEGAVQCDGRKAGWSHRVEPGHELRFQREARGGPKAFDPQSEAGHRFMGWVHSRPMKDGGEPGKIHKSEFHNPEKEHREHERRRKRGK